MLSLFASPDDCCAALNFVPFPADTDAYSVSISVASRPYPDYSTNGGILQRNLVCKRFTD